MRGRPLHDGAVSDLVGTLLMIGVVVSMGSVVAVIVFSTLSDEPDAFLGVSLLPAQVGDQNATLRLDQGLPVPVVQIDAQVALGNTSLSHVTAVDADGDGTWELGERLYVAVPSPLVGGQNVRVFLLRLDANAILIDARQTVVDLTSAAGANLTLSANVSTAELAADGVSVVRLNASLSSTAGLLNAVAVVVDATPLGQPGASLPLHDDGSAADVVGGDGVWAAWLRAASSNFTGPIVLNLSALDAHGRSIANASVNLTLVAPLGGVGSSADPTSQAGVGSRFVAPSAENVTGITVANWTYNVAIPSDMDKDEMTIRVVGGGKAWSATLLFDFRVNTVWLREIRLAAGSLETTYRGAVDSNGVPLDGYRLDLLDPLSDGNWSYQTGDAHPLATYGESGISGSVTASIVAMGHNGDAGDPRTAIYGADIEVT